MDDQTFDPLRDGLPQVSDTGGRKRQKLARYALIPPEAAEPVWMLANPRDNLTRWWWHGASMESGEDETLLTMVAVQLWTVLDVCFGSAMHELAEVYGHGARKYEEDNWRKGYPWSWNYEAAMRHLRDPWSIDEESGQPHAAHALWHVLTLLYWLLQGERTYDDRPRLPSTA